ncbi:hypothetical protein PYCCODRAFT_109533 [Trametes coccinea BRFM310]|uniref:Uncharacterized protein n=1 Tax=Trametes coccinea (strain BRFM310) TaxID=1353009 RepID=A0A1Y2ITW2_TRAC3|nr:hypothetical protein PYCCODRAFT_109533 [Trametes coccinea BRFM310]
MRRSSGHFGSRSGSYMHHCITPFSSTAHHHHHHHPRPSARTLVPLHNCSSSSHWCLILEGIFSLLIGPLLPATAAAAAAALNNNSNFFRSFCLVVRTWRVRPRRCSNYLFIICVSYYRSLSSPRHPSRPFSSTLLLLPLLFAAYSPHPPSVIVVYRK